MFWRRSKPKLEEKKRKFQVGDKIWFLAPRGKRPSGDREYYEDEYLRGEVVTLSGFFLNNDQPAYLCTPMGGRDFTLDVAETNMRKINDNETNS